MSLLPVALLGLACGEPLPTIPLDPSAHDACSESLPYTVDASSSEIQCFIENYVTTISGGLIVPSTPTEVITNQPGDPICCEVCANKGTADQACDAMCNWQACDRARDDHIDMGNLLGVCDPPDCGFDFESCMAYGGLHSQWINVVDGLQGGQDDFYALQVDCEAHAVDSARPDGLFTYLEELDGVPNAGGKTAEVTDVVEWCSEKSSASGGADNNATWNSTSNNADGTGEGTTTDAPSDGADASALPERCGPWATQRMAANPTDNFGTWNDQSEGSHSSGVNSQPIDIAGGGIEYRVLPCGVGTSQECLRIDRLSVRLVDPASMLEFDLNLLEKTEPMPIAPTGWVEIPAGALHLGVRYTLERSDVLVHASNTAKARARLDPFEGQMELVDLEASSNDGDLGANLSLRGTLLNTQPQPKIIVTPGPAWNEVVLSASTYDAELDPITHRFIVLGQGTWTTDTLELSLPPGRHAVVLYADDIHGARGIAATWVEIGGAP